MARVLLADSQPLFNEALEALLSCGDAHQVIGRNSSAEEILMLAGRLCPDLVLIDAGLGLEGLPSLIARILEIRPEIKVLVVGGDCDPDLLLASIRAGAAEVTGKTHGSSTMLRVTGAALDGDAAMPRSILLELTRRMISRERAADSPLSRLSPREREVLALLAGAGTTTGSARSCSSASTLSAPTSRTSSRSSACTPSWRRPPPPCSDRPSSS